MANPNSFVPNFKGEHLKKVYEDVREVFSSHRNDINSVSEDIKNIESWLKSENIVFPFSIRFPVDGRRFDSYILEWDKIDSNLKDFRLILYTEQYPYPGEDIPEYGERRPLIECSLSVRMEVYPFLSIFLTSLADKIKIKTPYPINESIQKNHISDDDQTIPF